MNFDQIKELMTLFDESQLSRVDISEEEFSIRLEKHDAKMDGNMFSARAESSESTLCHTSQPVSPRIPLDTPVSKGEQIFSPMVGTFYRAPAPDATPFVKEGDTVKKGQTLCVLEAMKIMNEFEAEFDGKVVEIIPDDGQPVEYGAPLFVVEKH
jgi:acetyl-CoA carboxylase biotin carboxyl carrier protein